MIPYRKPSYRMTDDANLYRFIVEDRLNLIFIRPTDRISLTRQDLYALIKEMEQEEKKNAAKVY